jgi:hypothetical protein
MENQCWRQYRTLDILISVLWGLWLRLSFSQRVSLLILLSNHSIPTIPLDMSGHQFIHHVVQWIRRSTVNRNYRITSCRYTRESPCCLSDFALFMQACQLTLPKRVSYLTDCSFGSGYSKPNIVVTQIPLTGAVAPTLDEDFHLTNNTHSHAHTNI